MDINVNSESSIPCPYPIPPSNQRKVHLRINPADIGADTIAAICRWYTFGQTVHQIIRKINNRRAVTDTIGLVDVYAILAIKIDQGLVSAHEPLQLAKDEFLPQDFLTFYEIWQDWKGEKWMRDNKPLWNHLAVRSVNRALNARYNSERDQVDENAKELFNAKEAEEAQIDAENTDALAGFVEIERKHPILTLGKRVIAHGKIAYLVYGDDIKAWDKRNVLPIIEREKLIIEEIENEEIAVKPEEWLTIAEKEKRIKIEEMAIEKVRESLPPQRSKEECEVIDTFADNFEFCFDEEGEEGEEYIVNEPVLDSPIELDEDKDE